MMCLISTAILDEHRWMMSLATNIFT